MCGFSSPSVHFRDDALLKLVRLLMLNASGLDPGR